MGFPSEVLEALALLTHDKATPYLDYVARIKSNPTARAVKLADLCLTGECYAVVEAPKAAKAQNSDYALKLTQKATFTGRNNNDWNHVEVLNGDSSGVLTKAAGGDVADYCDISKIDALYFDMTAGKTKVTFFDEQHKKIKVAVTMANDKVKTASSLTLAANHKTTDHFTIAAIDECVKYLKIEAADRKLDGYSITKIA